MYQILTPELGILNTKTWEPQAGELVAFTDYRGDTYPARIERIASDGTLIVRGNGLVIHKYWGVTLPVSPEKVSPAI